MALPDRRERAVLDGNAAVARVAHACSEIVAIYPITPSSPMSEATDAFSAAGKVNLWGAVPRVTQMQSEAGAAGALHGAATTGTCATTFTSSQGLLLMIPVMHKLAGELTPAVIHVAARTVATHALSIFGDHSDVMAVRGTGWAMLASTSVQEAHDLAAVAHAATLRARVPFLHFFDGFRTSHEEATIEVLASGDVRSLVEGEALAAFRARGLTPDAPVLRGTSANPDTYFQAREAANPAYDALPGVVEDVLAEFAALTGRAYRLVEYAGAPDAERVVVVLGSAWHTVRACVDALVAQGEKVGAATLHLYRPFPAGRLVEAVPRTVRRIAVLDRTKEPGAPGEPLLADVALALLEGWDGPPPRLAGGRYGLSSREFTPAMARAVFDELKSDEQRRRFTVGLDDDVTHLSLPVEQTRNTGSVPAFRTPRVRGVADLQAVFFGLGSDGSVGAAKATAAILGADGRYAQGYFVYDSRKA
ncbi:MAG: pyruvate:ferredoxin (flavodoxin) oxidoreductase, partial [Actinomycetia bacterium]|nr:pyruvate:ferredoxin (flavodoxin) oxidoreductase [Actinomycetes bacterium]